MSPYRITDLALTPQARDVLRAAARASQRREHGGILVGYREHATIHVENALEVGDHTAARTNYLRRAAPADQLLREYMHSTDDPYIGYVGEWHTHPAPIPPSPTDRASMRIMSMKNRQPVALIVAALEHDQTSVHLYGRASDPHPVPARLVGRHHAVKVLHP